MTWWKPEIFAKQKPYLEKRAKIIADIRKFFDAQDYLEVETPALQISPCMEPHIQAFKTDYLGREMYLHTSPEFAMKKLLVAGMPRIYQLAKVFRNEHQSSLHEPEFTLLEWYHVGIDYKKLMQETVELIRTVTKEKIVYKSTECDVHAEWEVITLVEALQKYAGVDISNNLEDLAHIKAEAKRIGVYTSPDDDWQNALLKIFMDKVEPNIGSPVPTIIYDYPISMAALARAKPDDPRFAERFELYICGVELCNAFGELTDAKIQRERFEHDVRLREETYGDKYPVDEDFLSAIEHGLPECSGNALGIDRLVMLLTGAERIDMVRVPVTT